MFLEIKFDNDMEGIVDYLNVMGIASRVHSLHILSHSPPRTGVVFFFSDYPGYEYFCGKIEREVQSPENFFRGQL